MMAARGKTSPEVVAGDWWTFLGFKPYKYIRSQASLALARRFNAPGTRCSTDKQPEVPGC